MKQLLKYELRKTQAMKLIILGITAAAELAFLIALFVRNSAGNTDEIIVATAFLLSMIAFGGILLIGIQSVLTLHRDMNTKQGYMLYMTPRNSYQILGAKMLENGISLVLAGAFFFLLGALDVTLLFSRIGQLEALKEYVMQFLSAINAEIELDLNGVLCLTAEMLSSWLATVSIAFLADIISSALLNGKRFNGLVTFIFFILLTILLNTLQRVFLTKGMVLNTVLIVEAAVALIYSAGMYLISAAVMERYLSV
ncbi:MAG: hypothetical protein IJR97_06190 [Clostridia bacterium]|nr:hypothetical protein [Clostridia bacterium]